MTRDPVTDRQIVESRTVIFSGPTIQGTPIGVTMITEEISVEEPGRGNCNRNE